MWGSSVHLVERQLLLRALVDVVAQLWDDLSVSIGDEHLAALDLHMHVQPAQTRGWKYLQPAGCHILEQHSQKKAWKR